MPQATPMLAVTPGEPAGIGAEILLKFHCAHPEFRLLAVADESAQMLEYSNQLEQKSRELTETAAKLRSANEKLTQLSLQKDGFLSQISHELRTPLTALMGFSETLRGAARDDANARDRFLEIMEGEASRMNRLVGDLLSLNRVESEERVRPKERIDLVAYLGSTIKSLGPIAESGGRNLALEAPDMPIEIPADPDQIQQVFTNLIENALKYGGENVTVSLTALDRDPALRCPAVRVQVIDDGPGIDPVHLPRLTERFYRADNHRSRELGGTGLGLAIVKHIINRHRGRLRIESDLGQGAVFTVVLPV